MEFVRGRLIVIDGTDGAGKETQSKRLVKKLMTEGHSARYLSFPQYGDNIFARTIAASLDEERFGDPVNISPYLISPIYSADRWKAKPFIEAELSRGTILVTNRYTSANMGHQGAKIKDREERQEFLEWLRRVEYSNEGFGIPQPDLNILLYLNPELSKKLIARRVDDVTGSFQDGHERNLPYQIRVANTFLEIAGSEPSWRVIQCMSQDNTQILPREKISDQIWETVRPFLPHLFDRKSSSPFQPANSESE